MNIYIIGVPTAGKSTLAKMIKERYLYGRTEAEFMEHFYDLAETDQVNKKFCDEKQIPYFMTVGEREKVLEKATQLVLSCLQS